MGGGAGETTVVVMLLVSVQSSTAHRELPECFWRLYKTTVLMGSVDCFTAPRESTISPIPEAQLAF